MFVIVTASHQNIRKHLSDCNNTIVRDSVSNGSIDGEDQLFGQWQQAVKSKGPHLFSLPVNANSESAETLDYIIYNRIISFLYRL